MLRKRHGFRRTTNVPSGSVFHWGLGNAKVHWCRWLLTSVWFCAAQRTRRRFANEGWTSVNSDLVRLLSRRRHWLFGLEQRSNSDGPVRRRRDSYHLADYTFWRQRLARQVRWWLRLAAQR